MSLDLEREQTVQLLCRQFALDHLSTEELEARLESAYKATSAEELHALVRGLPPVPMTDGDVLPYSGQPASLASARKRPIVSIFSSVRKQGDWEPGPENRAIAIFGELVLDFREALIPPGVTTVDVTSVFAQVTVIVPAGVGVECDGNAIFGEFSEKKSPSVPAHPDAPTIRVVGFAVFSEVSVKVKVE